MNVGYSTFAEKKNIFVNIFSYVFIKNSPGGGGK